MPRFILSRRNARKMKTFTFKRSADTVYAGVLNHFIVLGDG